MLVHEEKAILEIVPKAAVRQGEQLALPTPDAVPQGSVPIVERSGYSSQVSDARRLAPKHPSLLNAITFDVEEWFHAANLKIPPARWDKFAPRLDRPIDDILELLAEHGTHATFFVLGWVARRQPGIVRRIHAAGHEVASHGLDHRPIVAGAKAAFRCDLGSSKVILEDLTGQSVIGYRAPSYSINRETEWALDTLVELGFEYDSSIYPVKAPHGRYGQNGAPLTPHQIRPGLWEFPLPTVRLPGLRLPVATGAYLRIWPWALTRRAFRQNLRVAIPLVVNIHPWELDADQPRVQASWWHRTLHYTNLRTTRARLAGLLSAYRFAPLRELRDEWEKSAGVNRPGKAGSEAP